MKKLLLLSNSTLPGQPYLSWPKPHIDQFLGDVREVLFIPFAAVSFSYDDYEAMVAKSLSELNIRVTSIHHASDPIEAIKNAKSIFVGGGNTFHLLLQLQKQNLVNAIVDKVKTGTPYCGWSAGANMACPTIKTTNDMPVAEPLSFNALGLIGFQINPHYTEKTIDGHGGESRLQRLKEYVAINDIPVTCLPEGFAFKIEGEKLELIGDTEIKVIKKGGQTTTLIPGLVSI